MTTAQKIPNEVMLQLREHVDFIVRSSDAFDDGHQGEVKRFAVALRALFHDAPPMRSVLARADGLQGRYVSTSIPLSTPGIGKHGGLVRTAKLDGRPIDYAPLDTAWYARWMPFSEWWSESAYLDDQRKELTRRDLVLAVAGKEGGTNVDPALSAMYAHLIEQNPLSGALSTDSEPISSSERAAVRQIVHEVLRTLLPPYRKVPKAEMGSRLAAAIQKAHERPATIPLSPPIRRNDPCPCGSSKRFKFCHG